MTTTPTPSGYVTSVIRTAVPYLIGLIVSWLISLGLPASVKDAATAILTFVIGTIYYLGVRALEKKWPKLGWLLGSPTAPTYPAA